MHLSGTLPGASGPLSGRNVITDKSLDPAAGDRHHEITGYGDGPSHHVFEQNGGRRWGTHLGKAET